MIYELIRGLYSLLRTIIRAVQTIALSRRSGWKVQCPRNPYQDRHCSWNISKPVHLEETSRLGESMTPLCELIGVYAQLSHLTRTHRSHGKVYCYLRLTYAHNIPVSLRAAPENTTSLCHSVYTVRWGVVVDVLSMTRLSLLKISKSGILPCYRSILFMSARTELL